MKPDFEELYRQEIDFIWRQLRRFGVLEAEIEDAAQEVFLIAHRKLSTFDPERAKPRTWLWGIARGVASNRRRGMKRQGHRERVTPLPSPRLLMADVEARDQLRLVMECLRSLTEKQQEIFILVELEGFTIPEVSEMTGINPNTLSTRLRQGRQAFATEFASSGQSEGEK